MQTGKPIHIRFSLYFTVISFTLECLGFGTSSKSHLHCFCDCLRTEKLLRLTGQKSRETLNLCPRDELLIAESGRRVKTK